jgi:hypothetical protein
MPTLMQKLRLAWRGWTPRQAESAARKNAAFLKQASWDHAPAPAVAAAEAMKNAGYDLEGLEVAWLDDSGRIEHYLDMESGEVVEFLTADRASNAAILAAPARFRRVPSRSAESEAEERRAFLVEDASKSLRAALSAALESKSPGPEFRRILSSDRTVERAWYSFKNDCASRAVTAWLQSL